MSEYYQADVTSSAPCQRPGWQKRHGIDG